LSDTCVAVGSDGGADGGVDAGGGDSGGPDAGGPDASGSTCGDGMVDVAEECDGVDLSGATCLSLGLGFVGGTLGCTAACDFDTSGCMAPAGCGDGMVGGTEECDGANLAGMSCASLGFASGVLGCTGGCLLDDGGCFTCGDAVIEGPEACDGAATGGATCTSLGYGGGALGCTSDCAMLDESGCVGGPPSIPVLRKPMNGAYLGTIYVPGSLRPEFVWQPSTVSGGGTIDYEIEYATDASFAAGATTVSQPGTTYQPPADLAVSMTPPVGARWYWHVRACAMTMCSPWSPTWWLNVGRSDRDFNGDGYADLVVGAPQSSAAGSYFGRVQVYFGAAGGLDTGPDLIIDGTVMLAGFGYGVATAGDVNADGFSDLLVGQPWLMGGSTFLYLGGDGAAFDTTADAVLIGAPSDTAFGQFNAAAGDVNADGFEDVVVGAPSMAPGDGRAHVFLGGPGPFDTTADGVVEEPGLGERIGAGVTGAGDTNGDGYADVLVAMIDAAPGRAKLYLGGPGGSFDTMPDVMFMGMATMPPDDSYASAVSGGADMNDDGFADVVIGAASSSVVFYGAGATFFYLGSATGVDTFADGTLGGAATSEYMGIAASVAGDVNGDGFGDALVGAYGVSAYMGRAYIVLGGPGVSVDAVADGTLIGSGGNYALGVSGVGDLNGDLFSDVAVGAFTAGGTGAVYVYLGASGSSFDPTVDTTLVGAATDDFFGAAFQ
jgi:hypothetical protein